MDPLERRLDALCASIEPDVVRIRRHLHAHPELGWQEFETQRHLAGFLSDAGLDPRTCASTGLSVEIGDGDPGVIYRGDLDALPIDESHDEPLPYASRNAGVCHACGHDFHAAVAAGLARVFGQMAPDLPGRVRFVFQPAEEVVPSGAEAMIRDGAAAGMSAALALHVDPTLDTGQVRLRNGPLTSATDTFQVRIVGRSGHSARPYLAKDAILAATDAVRSLYTLISQRVNPVLPAVLNVGTIRGGEAKNVIAGEVVFEGVVRTLHGDVRNTLHREMNQMVEAVAFAHGCTAHLVLQTGAPPVINDPWLGEIAERAAIDVVGTDAVGWIELPSTGSEDFGMFGLHMPTYMLRVGVRVPGAETVHLHTPSMDVDDSALAVALRVMGRGVLRTMRTLAERSAA